MTQPNQLLAWQALVQHAADIKPLHMRDLFAKDRSRYKKLSARFEDILLDYSKNRVTHDTMGLLMNLARESALEAQRARLFAGEPVNVTEQRSVAHYALRARTGEPCLVGGVNVMPQVKLVLERMRSFTAGVRDGRQRGFTGKPFQAVVSLGIGGSHLGPALVCEALKPYSKRGLDMHFVSNVDGSQMAETLRVLNPETTLFLVASKTFTTQETLTNARTARRWLLEKLGKEAAVASHFVAISTNRAKVSEFGISPHLTFEFWDWVGGRYSLWSAIGMSIALSLGMERFEELLEGARAMDQHFAQAPLEENLPVLLGLLGLWHGDFMGYRSYAVVPYDHYLRQLPAYLQQVDMESNGKSVTRDGQVVDYATGPVVWGAPGTDGQHAFFQHLHQSPDITPVDFLVAVQSHNPLGDHQRLLLANCLAQAEALMRGRTTKETVAVAGANAWTAHKVFPGNRPSNMLIYPKLTPRVLGSLLALYEHKVFVQGALWNINSYDQFGVELGKQLADQIADELRTGLPQGKHDSSTQGLIDFCKNLM